jgi:hypothetical protein
MTNFSETQNATCRKVEKHLINYSAGEVTKASSSTVRVKSVNFDIDEIYNVTELSLRPRLHVIRHLMSDFGHDQPGHRASSIHEKFQLDPDSILQGTTYSSVLQCAPVSDLVGIQLTNLRHLRGRVARVEFLWAIKSAGPRPAWKFDSIEKCTVFALILARFCAATICTVTVPCGP